MRIIGGQWRGRRLPVPHAPGLRPTPDRVRETLFNWLQGVTEGARALDLFAGSGALGFEAASRGARSVVMVEADARIATHLREQAATLDASRLRVEARSVRAFLAGAPQPVDLVFLDPPYGQGLVAETLALLARGWLAPGAHLYIEAEAELGEPVLPDGWTLLKTRRAGQVGYHLARAPDASGVSPDSGD
ncbi:MAG TPA: 16S rRNA (guanine(966)-N(2))-methyltransferase RsmD [Thioalkalivibrio sp.]|nr:16S rRNA (guanine(966)-N(2))-methyltransferase RsmD [Thioalkalivibrio sp.]